MKSVFQLKEYIRNYSMYVIFVALFCVLFRWFTEVFDNPCVQTYIRTIACWTLLMLSIVWREEPSLVGSLKSFVQYVLICILFANIMLLALLFLSR